MEKLLIFDSDSILGAIFLMCQFLESLPILLCYQSCFGSEEDQYLIQPNNNTPSFFFFFLVFFFFSFNQAGFLAASVP